MASFVLEVGAAGCQRTDFVLALGLGTFELRRDVALDGVAVLRGQVDALVELCHSGFDLFDEDGAELAGVQAVASGAHEVWVDDSGTVLGVLHEQAGPAQPADDGGTQVVAVGAFSFAVAVRGEDLLYLVPGLLVGERLVASGVRDALEGDDTLVVGVA